MTKSLNNLTHIVKIGILKRDANVRVILMGDFNYHLSNFTEVLERHGIKGIFREKTHKNGNKFCQIFTDLKVDQQSTELSEFLYHALLQRNPQLR